MRTLTINDTIIDIDDQTSIGIDIQCWDINNIAKRKLNVSNEFSIPATTKNLEILHFPGNPFFGDTTAFYYDNYAVKYYINSNLLLSGYIKVTEITKKRIKLFITDIKDIWEDLKLAKWVDTSDYSLSFTYKYLQWADLPLEDSYVTITDWDIFITLYNNHAKICAPSFNSNLAGITDAKYITDPDSPYIIEDTKQITFFTNASNDKKYNGYGAHWCIPLVQIFKYIEDTYNVNFQSSGGGFPGNIFDDPYFKKIYIPAPDIVIDVKRANPTVDYSINVFFDSLYKKYHTDFITPYIYSKDSSLKNPPFEGVWDKTDKTLYDLLQTTINYFNLIIDYKTINGVDTICLRRFDDINNFLNQNVINWSGKITDNWTIKPNIEKLKGRNYIKFKNLHEGADEYAYSKLIAPEPSRWKGDSDILEIDALLGKTVIWESGLDSHYVPYLNEDKLFKHFVFLYVDGYTYFHVKWHYVDYNPLTLYDFNSEVYYALTGSTGYAAPLAQYYGIQGEYTLLDHLAKDIFILEIEKYLTMIDIINLEFFNQYFIREFGGAFFINKISGFNPDKSNEPTKIELIKISNKMPDPLAGNLDYYCDGAGIFFSDGDGSFFI